MPIGVYRLYVGSGWMGEDSLRRLMLVLDRVPGFLFRIDCLPPCEAGELPETREAIKARVRIAMTQAHMAILDPEQLIHRNAQTEAEIELARTGFRRRIPLLGVNRNSSREQLPPCPPDLDRLVPLEAAEIASAIQELAEQTSDDRRRTTERLLHEPLALVCAGNHKALQGFADASAGTRSLPVAEIMSALAEYKRARGRGMA